MTASVAPDVRPAAARWLPLALLGCCVLIYVGWRAFWHYVDDGYILFRYVSNCMDGRGLVWNPAPFAPVDGNTDFLWSIVLLVVWGVLGIEPPEAANTLSLLFGYGTFALVCRLLWRLPLPEALASQRPALLLAVALGMAGNRVFFASLSSGLGIALFQFCLFAWLSLLLGGGAAGSLGRDAAWSLRRGVAVASAAALCGLARPDGYLPVLATALCIARQAWQQHAVARAAVARGLAMASPLLLVAAHLLGRRLYYGAWMPNPYYAKNVAPWPASGSRYFASFAFEFGGCVWLPLAGIWCVRRWRQWRAGARPIGGQPALVAAAVIAAHFGYYTLVIGGDMFEYRVYTHLFPLWLLTTVTMACDLWPSPRPVWLWLGGLLLAAQPIPWLKYAHGDGPIAEHVPALVRPLVAAYDGWQRWMTLHMVGLRNTYMKGFATAQASLPERSEGRRIPWDGHPVYACGAVGLVGWVLPNVAIIDTWGLNDYVVARHPIGSEAERTEGQLAILGQVFDRFDHDGDGRVDRDELAAGLRQFAPELRDRPLELQGRVQLYLGEYDMDLDGTVSRHEVIDRSTPAGDRRMAHDRFPPAGYLAGFHPNVVIENRAARVLPRREPLTAEQIRAHEARFRALAQTWQ